MSKAQDKGQSGQGLLQQLTQLWPSLPYLSFGLFTAWMMLAYSGDLWLSDIEVNGSSLVRLYFITTLVSALFFIVSAFFSRRLMPGILEGRAAVIGGLICVVGAVLVLAAGPYYLGSFLDETGPIFNTGAAILGVGNFLLSLRCAGIYCSLPPRRVLINFALSQFVVVFVYLVVISSPQWALVEGGPTYVGMAAFTFLPLLAALLSLLPRTTQADTDGRPWGKHLRKRDLPGAFWRLVALALLLSFAASIPRGEAVSASALAATVEGNTLLALSYILTAGIVILVALRIDSGHLNVGRFFSLLSIVMVVVIAVMAVFGAQGSNWSLLIYLTYGLFEICLWCLLCFITYQRHISPVVVFGFGFGALLLGSALGWGVGLFAMPSLSSDAESAFYFGLAIVVLVLSFFLFSESEFEKLFTPIEEDQPSLEEMLSVQLGPHAKGKAGRFGTVIDRLAAESGLTAREAEVLRLLAMGNGVDAIAEKLSVSRNTARSHTHNIYVKMDVHSRQELIDKVDEAFKD